MKYTDLTWLILLIVVLFIGYRILESQINNMEGVDKQIKEINITDKCDVQIKYSHVERKTTTYSNPRIEKEMHTITNNDSCKRKCAVKCLLMRMKYHDHRFKLREEEPQIIFFNESSGLTEYLCLENTCLCKCEEWF